MTGQVFEPIRSRAVLRPLGRALCAFGVLASILAGSVMLSGEPPVLRAYAPTVIEIAAALAGLGALLWAFGGLRQRLFETEQALVETRTRLEAAMIALAASRPERQVDEPVFRSRPAGRRRFQRQA